MSLLDELLTELLARGWPKPTEYPRSNMIEWSASNNDTGIRHVIAAWLETQVVEFNDETGAKWSSPTGKLGVKITGRGNIYMTAFEAADALQQQVSIYWDAGFLKMFGLKRDWGLPGAPICDINRQLDRNQYGEVIRSMGIW